VRLRVACRALGPDDAAPREEIESVVRSVLGRHAARLAAATVELRRSSRMHGAERVCCRIRARRRDGRRWLAADAREAALRAALRVEHRIELERSLASFSVLQRVHVR
jgi:hypothetical protein